MSRNENQPKSILIVTADPQFEAIVRRSTMGLLTIDVRKSGAMARRCVLEKDYDLVVINAPLPDELGEEFAKDTVERSSASVLLVVPQDLSGDLTERTVDHGILTLAKPFPRGRIDQVLRYLTAVQKRILTQRRETESMQQKLEELRIVSRAKLLLVERKQMSEDEAHRFIGKQAMDNGVSRKRIAERILEEMEQ